MSIQETDFIPEQREVGEIVRRVEGMAPADAAMVIAELGPYESALVMQALDGPTAARVVSKMNPAVAAVILCPMSPEAAAGLLEHVRPDNRVDILEHLPVPIHELIVGHMAAEQADEVRRLEQYPPDSAGGIMTTEVTALSEQLCVDDAIAALRKMSEHLEQLNYIYVIDAQRQLVGVLSMRGLFLAWGDKALSEIMRREVQSVRVDATREQVAEQMRKHGFVGMPVVDPAGRIAGMVTLDDVVGVYEQQATADVQRMFGAGAEERLTSPWQLSLRKRFWWLEINLLTALVGAWIVAMFTTTIAAAPILAAYLTVVGSMGANAGAQAMAIAIRGIAAGESRREILRHALKREFMVGLFSGVAIGATTTLIVLVSNRSSHGVMIGAVVCVSLVFNHVNACVTGVLVPFGMKRLGFDPAQSASIIATSFTDCGGFLVCLLLARLGLYLLGVQIQAARLFTPHRDRRYATPALKVGAGARRWRTIA